ncbi:hypothetical protein ACI2KE_03415 [Pseudomonas monteilii]
MINIDPDYMFKGSLAGLALVFVPLTVLAIEFRMLTVPVVVVALELFMLRCRCVYWGQRFSSYAILIVSLQLSVAPLLSSALIAVLTSGKLVYVESLAMTLAPIVSTLVFIVIYSRKPVVQPLFTVYGDRVLMRIVTPSRSQWWWLAGGGAACFGHVVVGHEYAQYGMAFFTWILGLYFVVYLQPAIHGLRELRAIEKDRAQCFKFSNQDAIEAWRANRLCARLLKAVRSRVGL